MSDDVDKMLADEKAQRAAEEARQKKAIAAINRLYGLTDTGESIDLNDAVQVKKNPISVINLKHRESGYSAVKRNATDYYNFEINEDHIDAMRAVRFGLARASLAGGSVDLDEMSDLALAKAKAVAQANRNADSQVSNLRASDENQRADLISRITAGLTEDAASSIAGQSMATNYQKNLAIPPLDITSLFSGFAGFWNGYQTGLGEYRGRTEAQNQVNHAVGSYHGKNTID